MKKIGILLMLICFIFCAVPATAQTLDETVGETVPEETEMPFADSGVTGGIDAPGAMLGTEKLINNVRAAVLYEANSQTMMYSWNADTQMYPASFVKIMTAMVALREGDLSSNVTVKQSSIEGIPQDAISVKLMDGEVLSLNDLMYCMIVTSANDAAVVIAEHIAGSEQAFVEKMNAYAEEIGCVGTHFTNVTGLHDDNQHITARDAARMLDLAMRDETFSKMFTTYYYDVPATNKSDDRHLSSSNSMMDTKSYLYYDARVIGGRAGVTYDGRRSMAAVSESNGMRIISIVMGTDSVYQEDGYTAIRIGGYKETTALLDLCYNGYKVADILFPNQTLRQIPLQDGNSDVVIGPKESVLAVLPQNAKLEDLIFRYTDKVFSAPVEKGQPASDVQVWINGACVAEAELYAMNRVEALSNLTNNGQATGTGGKKTFLIILVVLVAGVGVVVAVRSRDRIKAFVAAKLRPAKPVRRRRK